MSKYNLTDILNEYIGGGRIGTLNISYRDLLDKMDDLEKSGKAIVRTLSGPSGDGKVNREFEVVTNRSAVPGGNKQERGFTVYDYKFGFDPGSEEHFMEEYPFSVGGNDLDFAMELIDGVKPLGLNEENVIKDLAQADEVIKMIKMMNPDVRQDLLMKIARMGQKKLNEGDLFSSKFDRQELKAIINDLNKGLILDMPTRRAYKFLVSLLDKEDKEELGLNEQMYIDDEEFEMEMGRSKKDSLRKEMMFHVNQLMDGNIDKNDFMNVVEDIMAELGLKEGHHEKGEMDEVMGVDRKGRKKSDYKSNLTNVDEEEVNEDRYGMIRMQLDKAAKKLQDGPLKGVPTDIVIDFIRTHIKDIRGASDEEIRDEFEEFRSVNYDYIDENLKKHFDRFK